MRLGDILGRDILDLEGISEQRSGAAEFVVPRCCISPVSPRRAAQAAGLLIRRKARGLFHYSHDGHASLAQVYSEILNIFNEIFHETIDCKIHEVDSREIPAAAKGPVSMSLIMPDTGNTPVFLIPHGRMPSGNI
jgi:dTDP-4-dehydrorhamnose reductase